MLKCGSPVQKYSITLEVGNTSKRWLNTLLSICMVYEYDTILALPFPFPRKIETVHSDKKIDNTTVTLGSCLERESCPCSWV